MVVKCQGGYHYTSGHLVSFNKYLPRLDLNYGPRNQRGSHFIYRPPPSSGCQEERYTRVQIESHWAGLRLVQLGYRGLTLVCFKNESIVMFLVERIEKSNKEFTLWLY